MSGREIHEPLFTVMMATYNRAHLLPRAVKSVLNQTYQSFELVIVDDGSADNTEEVCRSFGDQRIVYYKHDRNRGVLAARNTALHLAKGDYVAILDDDDDLLPEALEIALRKFEELSSQDIGIVWFDKMDVERKQRSGRGVKQEGYIRYEDILCERVVGDFWQVMQRRAISDDDRFDVNLWCGEVLFWLKLHRKSRAYYVPKVLYMVHRYHGSERVSDLTTMLNHLPRVVSTNRALIEEFGDEQKVVCPKTYGRRLGILGIFQILNGEKTEGRRTCRQSLKYHVLYGCLPVFLLSFVLSGNHIRWIALRYIGVVDIKRRTQGFLGHMLRCSV